MKQPRKNDLINYVIDNELNMYEYPNQDCSDIEQVYQDPAKYLADNYATVLEMYLLEEAA